MKTWALALLLIGLLCAPLLGGDVYYVDSQSGNDEENDGGSPTSAFRTIGKGLEWVAPGKTLRLKGTFLQDYGEDNTEYEFHANPDGPAITITSYENEPPAVITSMKSLSDGWTQVGTSNVWEHALIDQKIVGNPLDDSPDRVSNCSQYDPELGADIPLRLMTPFNDNPNTPEVEDHFGQPGHLTGPGQWVRNVNTHKLYVWPRGEDANPNEPQTHIKVAEFAGGTGCTIRLRHGTTQPNHYTFEDLVIEGGYGTMNIETDHIVIRNCILQNTYYFAMQASGDIAEPVPERDWSSKDGLIENCEIRYFGNEGVDLVGVDGWIVRGNDIHHSVANTVGGTGAGGIQFKGGSTDTIVERNYIHDLAETVNGAMQIGGHSGNGVTYGFANEATNCIARNNVIRNVNSSTAIVTFKAAHGCKFYNNLVYQCAAPNLVAMCRSNADEPATGNVSCVIQNNIFLDNANYFTYCEADYGCMDGEVSFDYNMFDSTECSFRWNSVTYDLAGFQGCGLEEHSLTDPPQFVNIEELDFRPVAGGTQVDHGDPNYVAGEQGYDDCDEKDRCVNVLDIGPYEFFPGQLGDFNGDGAVTHGDYTVWADNFGQTITTVHETRPEWFPDGSYAQGATAVTHGMYTTWADHFGETVLPAGQGASLLGGGFMMEMQGGMMMQMLDSEGGPALEYTSVDLGDGKTGYTFYIANDDELALSYAIKLGFQGINGATIRQIKANGGLIAVNIEGWAEWDEELEEWNGDGALLYDAADPSYEMDLDSWAFNIFGCNPTTGSDPLTGLPLNGFRNATNVFSMSLSTGANSEYGDAAAVAYIVADGDVQWTGSIARHGVDYEISGSTAE